MPYVTGIKTALGVDLQVLALDGYIQPEPDPSLVPMVQSYRHFDLTDELLGQTPSQPSSPQIREQLRGGYDPNTVQSACKPLVNIQ